MPHNRDQQVAAGRQGGKNSRSHGIHSFEERGAEALTELERASLRDLKQLIRTSPGRDEVRSEIVARLVIICRKAFHDMELQLDDPEWWESGVVRRAGTYLAELRRWLDSFPPDIEQMKDVTEALAPGSRREDSDE